MKTTLVLMVTALLVAGLQAAEPLKDESKPFNITTTLGETYKNCRITKVTPEALTVVHDGGVAKLSFSILGDEWRQKFNYDPEKAREFAQAEEQRLKEAGAKRAAQNKKRELSEEEMMADLAAQEKKRAQSVATSANSPLAPLAPMPPDPSGPIDPSAYVAASALQPAAPSPGTSIRAGEQGTQPVLQTEVVVPTVTPITDVYTPTKIRSETYVFPDAGGYYYGGYAPYGYYQPIYSYPGQGCPLPPYMPSSPVLRPGVTGTISTGNTAIRFSR